MHNSRRATRYIGKAAEAIVGSGNKMGIKSRGCHRLESHLIMKCIGLKVFHAVAVPICGQTHTLRTSFLPSFFKSIWKMSPPVHLSCYFNQGTQDILRRAKK